MKIRDPTTLRHPVYHVWASPRQFPLPMALRLHVYYLYAYLLLALRVHVYYLYAYIIFEICILYLSVCGVATMNRHLMITGLFCRISSLL